MSCVLDEGVAGQTKPTVESMRWLIITVLVMFTAGLAFLVYEGLFFPNGAKSLGGVLLAIGAFNALFSRSNGRKTFAQTQSSRLFGASFWVGVGEGGLQLFYLGSGVIFCVAGCILLVFGSA
jgi:hypothetical protein